VHILASYCACGVQWLRRAQSKRYTRLGASLPEKEAEPVSEMLCIYRELDDGQSKRKKGRKKEDC